LLPVELATFGRAARLWRQRRASYAIAGALIAFSYHRSEAAVDLTAW